MFPVHSSMIHITKLIRYLMCCFWLRRLLRSGGKLEITEAYYPANVHHASLKFRLKLQSETNMPYYGIFVDVGVQVPRVGSLRMLLDNNPWGLSSIKWWFKRPNAIFKSGLEINIYLGKNSSSFSTHESWSQESKTSVTAGSRLL